MTPVTPLPGLPELPDDLENTQVSVGRLSEPERLVSRLGELGWTVGVAESLLAAHGPVHTRVARQMADGVRRALGREDLPADVGIATTGIAGPVSPDGQPVGTVHVAVSTPLGSRVESVQLAGDRAAIRAEAAALAVRLALEAL